MTHRVWLTTSLVVALLSAGCGGGKAPATAMGGAGVFAAPDAIAPIDAPFPMTAPQRPDIPDRSFSIRDYGAVEGGEKSNTTAIAAAISAAAKAGGGVVVIPAGRWLTGPIHLESRINLRAEKGAVVAFSQDPADYAPAIASRHEGIECSMLSPFIHADGKHDIAITGEGTFDGQGKPWWSLPRQKEAMAKLLEMVARNVPVEQRIFDGKANPILRPVFVQPMNCRNVLIEGPTFTYGAFWTISPVYCENVIVRRIRIVTEGEYGHTPNGDGINPDSCRNVLIEYCDLNTGDDCVTLKSGRDADGLRVNRPTENVVMRHCITRHGHGGIVLGSETSGGIRNVLCHDCTFNGTDRGIRIKTARGRGNAVQNVWVRDVTMGTIKRQAIDLDMLYTGKRLPAGEVTAAATPHFRNMHFVNIACQRAAQTAISIHGLPEAPIEGLELRNVAIRSAAAGIDLIDVKDSRFAGVSIKVDRAPAVSLLDVAGVTFDAFAVDSGVDPVFRVAGKTHGIVVRNSPALPRDKIATAEGSDRDAISFRQE